MRLSVLISQAGNLSTVQRSFLMQPVSSNTVFLYIVTPSWWLPSLCWQVLKIFLCWSPEISIFAQLSSFCLSQDRVAWDQVTTSGESANCISKSLCFASVIIATQIYILYLPSLFLLMALYFTTFVSFLPNLKVLQAHWISWLKGQTERNKGDKFVWAALLLCQGLSY